MMYLLFLNNSYKSAMFLFQAITFVFCACFAFSESFNSDFNYRDIFKPCKKCDYDCIKNSAQLVYDKIIHGIPSLGIRSSEPIYRPEISGETQKLHYNFTDSVITGFSHCDVNKIKVDFYDSCFKMELLCYNFMLTGKYVLDGYFLDTEVHGKGHYKIFGPKYKMGIDTKFVEVKDDGKVHMSLKDSSLTTFYNTDDKITIKIDSCKDNEELEKLLNKNWREVVDLFQGPFADGNLKLLVANTNKFLEHVSIDDMFLH